MKIANNRKLEFSPGTGICTAIIAACIAWAPQAKAITFSGNTNGIFVNPTGPTGMTVSGVGTNDFQWGVPFQSSTSRLIFSGDPFANITTDQFFNLGTLSYFNGTAWLGTEANTIDFRAILGFTAPTGIPAQNFDFDFTLVNTPNVGSAVQNADTVSLLSQFPTTVFNVGGIDYTLKMGFGSVTGGGFSQTDKFSVLEGNWASAQLVGLITAINPPPPSVPDTGSTLALMAMAIVGVGGVRQYLARKTA
jgi:hypothetical protein